MKKTIIWALTCIYIVALAVSPISVSANAPPSEDILRIRFENLPKNVVFADLLIKINSKDRNYTPLNEHMLEVYNLVPDCDIVAYKDKGFESFTFHYKEALSGIRVKEHGDGSGRATFGRGYRGYLTQYEDLLTNYRRVKIAFLDVNGSIVSLSKEFTLPLKSNLFIQTSLNYNYPLGSVDLGTYINPYIAVFMIALILLSVGIETLAARYFWFRGKYIAMIAGVNFITQGIMRLLYFILPWPHLISTIILEALVYTSEFFIYKKVMKEVKMSRILIYTIVANTLSLTLGIWVLNFLRL